MGQLNSVAHGRSRTVLEAHEQTIVNTVHDWVNDKVKKQASERERSGEYPHDLIDDMKQMGLFGLRVPEPHGQFFVSARCFALVTEELARGWMSLAGAMGGHTVVCSLISEYGTGEQQRTYLPGLADGSLRATMALTEPTGGSDLQAIRTIARRQEGIYVVDGTKTWIGNAAHSDVVALLCKTDPKMEPAHRGMSILLLEQDVPGYTISRNLSKLGYNGVEHCELSFDSAQVPARALLGSDEGKGFNQMMRGLQIGRLQVAARAVGVARAAFEDARIYAETRTSFGQPIWRHQSVGNLLADMATKLHASRLLVLDAAEHIDSGDRADLEAGMAKLFASETAMTIAMDSMRVHGGRGYSTDCDVERYFRDAPLMIIGEGTNEIQRNVIVRQLYRESTEPTPEEHKSE